MLLGVCILFQNSSGHSCLRQILCTQSTLAVTCFRFCAASQPTDSISVASTVNRNARQAKWRLKLEPGTNGKSEAANPISITLLLDSNRALSHKLLSETVIQKLDLVHVSQRSIRTQKDTNITKLTFCCRFGFIRFKWLGIDDSDNVCDLKWRVKCPRNFRPPPCVLPSVA